MQATDELRQALLAAAGERVFQRGAEYHRLGQVLALAEYQGALTAIVQGRRRYQVLLCWQEKSLRCRCDCPAAMNERCCKHGVAVGLAYLEQSTAPSAAATLADVAEYLAELSPAELRALLMSQALDDARLRERLLLAAANQNNKPLPLPDYYRAVDLALSQTLWLSGSEAGSDYLRLLHDSLKQVRAAGRQQELQQIVAYARSLLATKARPTPESLTPLRDFSTRLLTLLA